MMNRRQQKYFLLGTILLSFLLLGQNGEGDSTCDSLKRCGLAAANWYVGIDQKLEGCSDASTNGPGLHVPDGRTAEFELKKGNCSSVSFDNPEATSTYNITYMENDTLYVENVKEDMDITVTFYGDCSGEYLLVPPEECSADETPGVGGEPESEEDNGGTPLITDGEPVNELPKDEVHPEPKNPVLTSPAASCKASGVACAFPDTFDPSCCSHYCGPASTCW